MPVLSISMSSLLGGHTQTEANGQQASSEPRCGLEDPGSTARGGEASLKHG